MATTTAKRTQLLDIPEAARRLACSRGHIYGLIATGELPVVDIARKGSTRSKTRVFEDDIEAYIAQHTRVA